MVSSPAMRLPQELVDMVITHLTYDTRNLLTCSLVSRSWYIAATRHLHNTLTTHTERLNWDEKNEWPKPLSRASKLGVQPLIKELFISGFCSLDGEGLFSAKQFHRRTRREFSALTNIRVLSVDNLDIPSFMPKIRKYFGQFSPMLQSLTLKKPRGSCRQILFFIGLFPRLEDLGLHFDRVVLQPEPANYLELVPSSPPPLRGRLTASCFRGIDFTRATIDLFGGVRFRHMDLVHMGGTQSLLSASTDTLETLKLDATDICGEHLHSNDRRVPAHDFTDRSHLSLDLSRNGSLQTLEIAAESLIEVLNGTGGTLATAPRSFRTMFSTVSSPAFSDIFFVYRQGDFCPHPGNAGVEAMWYRRQFEVFHHILNAGDFWLTALVCREGDDPMEELFRAAPLARAKGLVLDSYFPCRWQGGNTKENLVGYAPFEIIHSNSKHRIATLPFLQDFQGSPAP